MTRLLIAIVAILFVMSCSKKKDDAPPNAAGGATSSGATAGEGIPDVGHEHGQAAIPDSADQFSAFDEAAQAFLRPTFDKAGKETSKTVAPGEQFDFYVIAEFNDALAMSAAEYKLVFPQGITVLGSALTDSAIVSLGRHDVDFMISFKCLEGPRHWIVKYLCRVEEDFAGGVVETVKGDNLNYLGFASCDASKTEIRARGGKAQLTKK
jgi:hypothetical protein